jgi:ATP-binding protein involved in chromosome partitioning
VGLAAFKGIRVGLLDADTSGPSIPRMMRLEGVQPEVSAIVGGRIVPLENHGVKCISMGSLVDADKALAWRGPMVGKALDQLVFGVAWGPLDVLLIDLPPGTGMAPVQHAIRCIACMA